MKKVKRPVFFIIFALIALFAASVIFGWTNYYGDMSTVVIKGVDNIRYGIDIKGGVDVTFTSPENVDATDSQLDSAKEVIVQRMINLGITDYECYIDYNSDRIIVRFPWKEGEASFDPESAVKELGETAMLTFREGYELDDYGVYTGVTAENVILVGADIKKAYSAIASSNDQSGQEWVVSLELTDDGAKKFAKATAKLSATQGIISIWMDETCVSYPTVNSTITDGKAQISGSFDASSSKALADKINSGALPFKLVTASFSTISPSLGSGALDAMVIAGLIAFAFIALFMIIMYKLPGFVSVIALVGQVAGTLAFISGYFGFMNSSILTIPGIAGIILAVGMGVDANVIIGERIKEELQSGKTLDGSINSGFKRAFTAILDGNLTMILVAIILMGAFGTTDSVFAKLLKFVFFMFGPSTAGAIYSFGFTLLTGVALNLFFGVLCSRLMTVSLSKFKFLRNPKLFGCKEVKTEITENTVKEHKYFDFLGKTKLFMIISGSLIAVSILSSFVFGVNMDIQFKGGTLITYIYDGEIDSAQFEADSTAALGGIGVKSTVGTDFSTGKNNIQLSLLSNSGLTSDKQFELTNALTEKYASNNLKLLESSDISPSSGKVFFLKCIVAVIFSAITLIIYIALRFKNIGGLLAGFCAVAALAHDCIIVYGTFIITGMSINANFIAVILTILGYSINNTIVIYDRIRENETVFRKIKNHDEIVNLSINQSLTRSINTSITTLFAMISVTVVSMIFGVTSIISFSFPMIVGIIIGTYSSVCFTCPFWLVLRGLKKSDTKSTKVKTAKA